MVAPQSAPTSDQHLFNILSVRHHRINVFWSEEPSPSRALRPFLILRRQRSHSSTVRPIWPNDSSEPPAHTCNALDEPLGADQGPPPHGSRGTHCFCSSLEKLPTSVALSGGMFVKSPGISKSSLGKWPPFQAAALPAAEELATAGVEVIDALPKWDLRAIHLARASPDPLFGLIFERFFQRAPKCISFGQKEISSPFVPQSF